MCKSNYGKKMFIVFRSQALKSRLNGWNDEHPSHKDAEDSPSWQILWSPTGPWSTQTTCYTNEVRGFYIKTLELHLALNRRKEGRTIKKDKSYYMNFKHIVGDIKVYGLYL